jgi:solute carrier family 25 carnitine/acylcarnitine transporter 20/29
MNLVDIAKDFICGCVCGWVQVVVMQPFETIKVRLINQSKSQPEYTGIMDCFRKIKMQ